MRAYFQIGWNNYQSGADRVAELIRRCDAIPTGTVGRGVRGISWQITYPAYAGYGFYNHANTPNTRSCSNRNWGGATWTLDVWGTAPPTSLHPGGVNVAYTDGSVTFITDNIDRQIWWAQGSRDLQENVDNIHH